MRGQYWVISKHLVIGVVCACLVAAAGGASAQTVTYSLGTSSDMLDAAFYAGESNDGTDVTSRFVLNVGVNNAGTQAIFWGINVCPCAPGIDNFDQMLYIVDIGSPSSWRRLGPSQSYNITNYDGIRWAPNDRAVLLNENRYDVDTGTFLGSPSIRGYGFFTNSFTRKASDNWLVADTLLAPQNNEIVFLPVHSDGTEDVSRDPVIVTRLGLTQSLLGQPLIFPSVSNDGTAVAFNVWEPATTPDTFDIYVLEDIESILSAPKIPGTDFSSLAPTSLSDLRIVDFRASESSHPALIPNFSQDGTLVFYSEDYNDALETTNLYQSIADGDWDILVANRDGTGDVRFNLAQNQGTVVPFPTGSRMTYVQGSAGSPNMHILATTLVATSNIETDTTQLPQGGTTAVIGGNIVTLSFTLTDSAVQVTAPMTLGDASGTTIELPSDQVINFPSGTTMPEISIFTPIDPVGNHQLPDFATQIPVIRTFGPPGTQFAPPISITITYSDAEVANIQDESGMIPYLYNVGTQKFEPLDAQFLGSVVVDVDANTLTFQTDHFSTYGIGFSVVIAPQRPWALYALAGALGITALWLLIRRRRRASPACC